MKIVYFGSDIFAVPALKELLHSKEEVSAVVTQPDKKRGRHLHLGFSAVKESALKNNLRIIQPDNLRDINFINKLKDIKPDLFVVAAYGKIIPKEVLAIPNILPINIHGSLLPKYRGAAPINWAIINGEKETGVTIIKMNEFMDAGEIISQHALDIKDDDTSLSLRERLSLLAAQLLMKTVEAIKSNQISLTPQNGRDVSFAPKLKKSDGLINWEEESLKIHNRVRGLYPWPGSFTYFNGRILKIHETEPSFSKKPTSLPGEVTQISPEAIVVATKDASLKIKSLQVESGNKLTTQQFVSGYTIKVGDMLG